MSKPEMRPLLTGTGVQIGTGGPRVHGCASHKPKLCSLGHGKSDGHLKTYVRDEKHLVCKEAKYVSDPKMIK